MLPKLLPALTTRWTPARLGPAALLAEYDCVQGPDPTLLYDLSPNGYHGTLGGGLGGAYVPTWSGGGLLWSQERTVGLPTGAGEHCRGVVAVASWTRQTWFQTFWAAMGPGNQYWGINSCGQPGSCGNQYGDPYWASTMPVAANSVGAVVWSEDPPAVLVNGGPVRSTYLGNTPRPGVTGVTLCRIGLGSGGGQGWRGTLFYLATSAVPITPTVARLWTDYAVNRLAARGVPVPGASQSLGSTALVCCVGDSIMMGYGASDNPGNLPAQLSAGMAGTANFLNLGVGGTVVQSLVDHAAEVDAALGASAAPKKVLCVHTATNDGFSPASYTLLLAYCLARKAAGWTHVIVSTGLPRAGTDANRAAWNTAMRTQFAPPWDAVADWGADLNMGQNGQQSNPTYYVDGLHPTSTGYGIGAAVYKTALASIGVS